VKNLHVISTGDGSSSILNLALNETYHSTHGAIQESQHVFIENGLRHFTEKNQTREVSIFEVGFGTGLNALLALQFAELHQSQIHYTSLDAFPIDTATVEQLNYPAFLGGASLNSCFKKIHEAPWNVGNRIIEHFSLFKVESSLQTAHLTAASYDMIFFDAFSPSTQPEMWTLEILEKIVLTMKPRSVFITYCAKGQLKRNLKSLGLHVESLPGPPGKREMVRATKVG
jgi:tRNA U34 5-methylaminomethyl-2-thiouridine-forming methyltransferase MnmC